MNYSFNNKNYKLFLIVIFSLFVPFSFADTQENINVDLMSIANNPALTNQQNQNDVELVMFIMKNIEDKNIVEVDKKNDFVNSFKVSDYIKNVVKSYIAQNINYSDNKKISYGIYLFKKCNRTNFKTNIDTPPPPPLHDFIKSGNQCFSLPLFDCQL